MTSSHGLPANAGDSRSLLRSVLLAGGARAAILPISATAGLLTTNLLVRGYGGEGFALYALVAFLPMMIPAADIGVGAAILDSVARREEIGARGVRLLLRRGLRRLTLAAAALLVITMAIWAMGGWPRLLGTSSAQTDIGTATILSLGLFALSIPASWGLAVLRGLERTHTTVLIQGGATVITLLLVYLCTVTDASLTVAAAAPSMATLCSGLVASALARPALHRALAELHVPDHSPELARGLPLSGSFLVITLALPLTFQTDRIVLSHVRGLDDVAIYSAGSQLWAPVVGVVVVAAQGLWPAYARRRGRGEAMNLAEFKRTVRLFTAVSVALALPLVALGPAVSDIATDGQARAGYWLMAAFGTLLVANGLQSPVGMLLLDRAGARLQATCAVLMCAANLPLAIWLSSHLGAPGVVLASTLVSLLILTLPAYLRVRREYGSGNKTPSALKPTPDRADLASP